MAGWRTRGRLISIHMRFGTDISEDGDREVGNMFIDYLL
jgi:hypothetical protein